MIFIRFAWNYRCCCLYFHFCLSTLRTLKLSFKVFKASTWCGRKLQKRYCMDVEVLLFSKVIKLFTLTWLSFSAGPLINCANNPVCHWINQWPTFCSGEWMVRESVHVCQAHFSLRHSVTHCSASRNWSVRSETSTSANNVLCGNDLMRPECNLWHTHPKWSKKCI